MKLWLGTNEPAWLPRTDAPLFISRRRLARRRSLPRALGEWALDSGGYTELAIHGRWELEAKAYAREAWRYSEEVGGLAWAACQDWLCAPSLLQKTGRSVREHQELTLRSLLELRALEPRLSWLPVLQGWEVSDYLRHAEAYSRAGLELAEEPLVGLGSVAGRQDTALVQELALELARAGLRLHGFGVKEKGLLRYGEALASADSQAWSYHARRRPPLEGCRHKNCSSCLRYALRWRRALEYGLSHPRQLALL